MYTRIYIPYRVYFLRETSSKLLKKSPISRTYSFRRERSRNKTRKFFLSWLVEFSERLCAKFSFIKRKKKRRYRKRYPIVENKIFAARYELYIAIFIYDAMIDRPTDDPLAWAWFHWATLKKEGKQRKVVFVREIKRKKQRKRKRTRLTKLKLIRE